MCLFISKTKGIILEKDLICYKQLVKQYDGTWKTPARSWTIPKLDSMIFPDEDIPEISEYGYKYLLDGGVIHAYLQIPTRNTGGLFYKAIIPAGTEIWIQDDLSEVASRKMYITSEEVSLENATLDISPLSHLGADLRLASGERVPLSPDINLFDVIGIYSGDKVILKDVNLDGIKFSEKPISGVPGKSLEEAIKDMDGEENCKLFPPDLPVLREVRKQGGYLPALGELQEAFMNLLEVNISRAILGLPVIPYGGFWTSTPCDSETVWCCDSYDYWDCSFSSDYYCFSCQYGYVVSFLRS